MKTPSHGEVYSVNNEYCYVYCMNEYIQVIDSEPAENLRTRNYMIDEKTQDFLQLYIREMAGLELPIPKDKPKYLSRKNALRIGKTMRTNQEWDDQRFWDWTKENIPSKISINREFWKLQTLFLEGGGIEIHPWRHARLFTYPSTGYTYLSSDRADTALKLAARESVQ